MEIKHPDISTYLHRCVVAASHVGQQLRLVHTVLAGRRAVGSPEVRLPKVVDAVVHVLVYLHVLRLADHRGAAAARVGLRRQVLVADVEQLGLLLALRLPVVEVVEVGHDDGNGQRDGQHSGDGAKRAHDLPPDGHGVHVPVADGRHGHHGPPESIRDAGEERLLLLGLGEVDGAGEQNHADEEEEDEQAQLSHARLESLAQNLEPLWMSGQFKDPEHPHQADYPENSQRCGLFPSSLPLLVVLVVSELRSERDEVRDYRHDINRVHHVFKERCLAGTSEKPDYQLKGKPDDAERLHHEERVCEDVRFVIHRDVPHDLHPLVGILLQFW